MGLSFTLNAEGKVRLCDLYSLVTYSVVIFQITVNVTTLASVGKTAIVFSFSLMKVFCI